jgi:hypothetical protein
VREVRWQQVCGRLRELDKVRRGLRELDKVRRVVRVSRCSSTMPASPPALSTPDLCCPLHTHHRPHTTHHTTLPPTAAPPAAWRLLQSDGITDLRVRVRVARTSAPRMRRLRLSARYREHEGHVHSCLLHHVTTPLNYAWLRGAAWGEARLRES